jgi:hypothetical protein
MKIKGSSKLLMVVGVFILALGSFLPQAGAFQAQTNDENAVWAEVKPVQLGPGQPAIFEVRLNTHSVNLTYDMVQVSSLQDSQGKVYKATAWKGSSPGGHHRRGTLEFPQLEGNPQIVKLVIKGIADVPKRVFEWKLEG